MSEHRLDLERRQRLGLVEAIWGEHKSAEQIIAIARDFERAGELALVTRVDHAKAAVIQESIPELVHHRQARCHNRTSFVRLFPLIRVLSRICFIVLFLPNRCFFVCAVCFL